MSLLPISVGLGLVVSLIFSELFGLAAGGMVVPGYVAMHLSRPLDVAVTIGAGCLTFAIVRAVETFLILYGRRRTVLIILVGYLVGMGGRLVLEGPVGSVGPVDPVALVGFIIPGLIALWLARQGVIETIAALLTAAVVVRLLLVGLLGVEVSP